MLYSITYKNSVQPEEIDNLNHMNVQYYVKHCLDACKLNFKVYNLPFKNENIEKKFSLERINIRYLNEQKLGTPFSIKFYISKIDIKEIHIFQEMENLETKKISATFILVYKIKFQKELIKNNFENFLNQNPDKFKIVPAYGKIKGLLNIRDLKLNYLKIQKNSKIFNSFCGLAKKRNNMDSFILDASDYMGIVSAAVPNLLEKSNHSILKTDIGGAAVEYEFYFNEFVQQGKCIKLLSGLRNIKSKTYTWSHWLIDLENKKVLAQANAVIVTMDLKKRKSVNIPLKMKIALEKLIID